MERIVLTIGYVPQENNLNIIYCGDSDSSGTMELNFEIVENICSGIANDFNVKSETVTYGITTLLFIIQFQLIYLIILIWFYLPAKFMVVMYY